MAEIRFYHLTSTPLERALPQLLEKALEAGFRVVVKSSDAEATAQLNTRLWTYRPGSFLPHGSGGDGNAAEQPVYLTDTEENPGGASLLAVTDGSTPSDPAAWERILDLFDGTDQSAVQAARSRWKAYKKAGHDLQYWQQTESGGWAQKG